MKQSKNCVKLLELRQFQFFLLQKAAHFHPIVWCNYLCVDGNLYVLIMGVHYVAQNNYADKLYVYVCVLVLGLSAGRAFRAFVSISNRFNQSIEFQNKFNFVSANIVIMNHNWMWWCVWNVMFKCVLQRSIWQNERISALRHGRFHIEINIEIESLFIC